MVNRGEMGGKRPGHHSITESKGNIPIWGAEHRPDKKECLYTRLTEKEETQYGRRKVEKITASYPGALLIAATGETDNYRERVKGSRVYGLSPNRKKNSGGRETKERRKAAGKGHTLASKHVCCTR